MPGVFYLQGEIMNEFLIILAWKLPLCIVAMSIGEWAVHRYVLHGRWLRRWKVTAYIYQHHHIEHHGRGENAIIPHIHLRPWDYWLAAPFVSIGLVRWYVFGQVTGLAGAVSLTTVCIGHMVLWNALHRAIHGLDCNWVTRIPGFVWFSHHHIGHHRDPRTNYGVVCIWSDRWFGTAKNEH